MFLLPLLLYRALEVAGTLVRRDKEIKGIADYMAVHVENLKESKTKTNKKIPPGT